MRRARDCESRRLGALYELHRRSVYALAVRCVRNAATAEDLVQETFLRAWDRRQSFDAGRGRAGAWILRIARNRAVDYLRSTEGRLAAAATELDTVRCAESRCLRDELHFSIDWRERLQRALATLPAQLRILVEMAYYEGHTQTEIAHRLGQPLGTVKTRIRTALGLLKDKLGAHMRGLPD